ncbi:putative inositol polyphosphate 5-phosphatase C9G1.10c [Termitomyces sp. T112]|nr:putative inositol polyphosphate 5-phosphatase C9G1.10c [Termitomyces sp. T112]KAH0586804.1 hypothetical protein H2248_005653 [Termitomyces sp. 'cryptogamus']
MAQDITNGVDTDRSPPVQNLRSKFEQLALDQSPTSRPRQSNGSQKDFLTSNTSPGPRPRATSSSSSNGTPFDVSHLRSSSSSSDLKVATKRPPPPPPSRPSKMLPNSQIPAPAELSAALLRPVPIPSKAHTSPRPQSPRIPSPSSLTSHEGPQQSSLRHELALAPPTSPRQPPPPYPPDTSTRPPVPPRHAKSDISFLRPHPQNSDNILDTNFRTVSPFSDDDIGENTPAAPPTHPSRRKPVSNHPPSSESSMASSESDISVSSRSSRPSSRFRTDASFASSPSTSPNPPPLPSRRPVPVISSSSEESSNISTRPPARPNVAISTHINTSDFPSPSSSSATEKMERKALGSGKLPPPPTRTIGPGDKLPAPRRPPTPDYSDEESGEEEIVVNPLPDCSRTSRRPPVMSFHYANVEPAIHIGQQSTVSVAGTTAVVAGTSSVKIYDLSQSDIPRLSLDMRSLVGKDYRILSMEFRPSAQKADRGFVVWLGTKEGHLHELDVRMGTMVATKYSAHPHAITHIFRYGRAMVTIDDSGKGLVWAPDASGGQDITLTQTTPRVVRISEHVSFMKIIAGRLWTAVRSETQHLPGTPQANRVPVLRVYDIFKPGNPSRAVVPSELVGAVMCATLISGSPGIVYVGHEAGSVSMWSLNTEDGYPQCIEVMKISNSDVLCVEGVNDRLWVGGRGGFISVYDVSARPWVVTNSWVAHPLLPVSKIAVDHYGIDKIGRLCVVSVGRDDQLRLWDGLLGLDWVDEELLKYEHTFAKTRHLKVLVVSWNVGAARPESLATGDPVNVNFLCDALRSIKSPDIISFGFQEVIDLESRKLAARNLLASSSRNEDGLSDRVSSAYRRWNDHLIMALRQAIPDVSYSVIHTHSLVGLFSCILIKDSEMERGTIKEPHITHIKRGMGGRYGNKGAIISRFILDDTSICLLNCHLAAGQNAVRQRNGDVTAILERDALFPVTHFPFAYVGGGDGTMILDHEIVIANGDMNYRIDHRRDAIISSIRTNDYTSLLTHDQLLREIKYNRACRFRGFSEGALTFPPTYKYDPNTNDYDTSEKRRSPAWCDRVLWRSKVPTRVRQVHYRRYEIDVSDHRPVSAAFEVTVKKLEREERGRVKMAVQASWAEEQNRLLSEAKRFYVRQALI